MKYGHVVGARIPVTAMMVLAASLALAGCKKTPGGQVAAVVNNEEITQREVRTDMTPAEQQTANDPATTRTVLDRVIDRNLLAQYARDQGLDRDPEFVARRRQLEQGLLATMAMRKIAAPAASPSAADVQAFITKNPLMFGQRQVLALDQISMKSPEPLSKVDNYTRLGTIDAIAAALTAQGIPFNRARQQLDTGGISNEFAAQVVGLKDGAPFALSTNGVTYLSVIVGRTPAVIPRGDWAPSATDALRQQQGTTLLNAAIARLRKGADIVYDSAFKRTAGAAPTNATAPAGANAAR